ncbi:MAG: hypothetical protein ACRCS8_01885 [Brevinema sp.]
MEKIVLPRQQTQKKTNDSIIISSRIDIFRNIDGLIFPDKLPSLDKNLIVEQYQKICEQAFDEDIVFKSLDNLSSTEKKNFYTNLLLFSDVENENESFSVFYAKDASWILAPNENSHFHLYSSDFGLSLKDIYKRLSAVVDIFEEHIHFSFHHDFGYLVPDITYVGNGLSCEVLVNLAGLEFNGSIVDLQKVCEESRLQLTPLTNYPHEKFFIVSNSTSFGISDQDLISNLMEFLQKLNETELQARKAITEKQEDRDFFAAQIMQILSKKSISYNESLEFIAIVDMLHKIMYKITDRTLWLEQIYRLQNNSDLFNLIENIEEINEIRMKLLTQIFNNTIVTK